MHFVLFVHSLVSDWNHGNAHLLRGVARELLARGHDVRVYEPEDAWSRANLVRDHGEEPLREFERAFPELNSTRYDGRLDVGDAVRNADLVLVHEWNDPALVARVGETGRPALFHDTHHRAVTRPDEMARYDLSGYAGVLAFGGVIRDLYLERGWARHAWTWHEAADARLFRPLAAEPEADLVWVGNWGDGERTEELREFLIEPARRLGLTGSVYGVRYPDQAIRALREAGLRYAGWTPNHRVPELFARHRVTVHVPRRPYASALPGIPTIRPFEALACGIPLVSAPWEDRERLFRAGDYFSARDGEEMERQLRHVLEGRLDTSQGLETIRRRHTCAHRVDELLRIVEDLEPARAA